MSTELNQVNQLLGAMNIGRPTSPTDFSVNNNYKTVYSNQIKTKFSEPFENTNRKLNQYPKISFSTRLNK